MIRELIELLQLPPIQRGFFILVAAGFTFPLTGVYILRLNLLTMRFMLMHGALLGGAIALALGLSPLIVTLLINVVLVGTSSLFSQKLSLDRGHSTTFFMVFAMGAAFAVMYKARVPAKDTLALLWGNLFAVSWSDVILTLTFGVAMLTFYIIFYNPINALIFDRDVARTTGVPVDLLSHSIMFIVGFTVAFSMKLMGTLLLDALLLLPAILASLFARSMRGIVILSLMLGGLFSIAGFFLAVAMDIPVSSGVVLIGTVGFIALYPQSKKYNKG